MLLGALMYAALIALLRLTTADTVMWNFVVAGVWNLLLLIVTVVVIVDSVRKVRARKTQQLATDVVVVKLAAIPFFVLNYTFLALLFLGGLMLLMIGGPALWVIGAIGVGLTYPAMLSTSVYAWAAILQLRREGVIKPGLAVLYLILSLLYVTDIATGILLFGHARRRPRRALFIVLLSFGVICAGVGLALGLLFGSGMGIYGLFGWIGVAGMVVGVAAIVISIVILPAVRRESQRSAVADGSSIESTALEDPQKVPVA
jgi:hypothetical protein